MYKQYLEATATATATSCGSSNPEDSTERRFDWYKSIQISLWGNVDYLQTRNTLKDHSM